MALLPQKNFFKRNYAICFAVDMLSRSSVENDAFLIEKRKCPPVRVDTCIIFTMYVTEVMHHASDDTSKINVTGLFATLTAVR